MGYHYEHLEASDFSSALTEPQIIERISAIDGVIDAKDALLQKLQPFMTRLLEAKHGEYEMPLTMFDKSIEISKQMYDDPSYNETFIHNHEEQEYGGDLNSRRGGEYYTAENYEDGAFTKEILEAAQALGFVAPELPNTPTDPIDQKLGIADSFLEPVEEEVEAVLVLTAKSISNPMRIRDTIRNIESGTVQTNRIVIASATRVVDDEERQKMNDLGLAVGNTEFESSIASFNELAGTELSASDAKTFSITLNGREQEGLVLEKTVELATGPIELVVIAAPYDAQRVVAVKDGKPQYADRTNSQEALLAAEMFLSKDPGTILLESHDVWTKSQAEATEQILGVFGKQIIPAGPFKLDRLKVSQEGELVLNAPGQVVDEIAKTFLFATQTRLTMLNAREKLMRQLEALHES